LEILKAWREKTRNLKPFSPVEVSSGPVTENALAADRIDLGIFPTPKWHEHDGGRYIGTGDMVITKDPDSGWINVGTYRACVVDKNRLTLWIIDHKHGKQIARKYWRTIAPVRRRSWAAARDRAARVGGQGRGKRIRLCRRCAANQWGDTNTIRWPAGSGSFEIVVEGEMPPPKKSRKWRDPSASGRVITHTAARVCGSDVQSCIETTRSCSATLPLPITERYAAPARGPHLGSSGTVGISIFRASGVIAT
jgi:hypothetical protein